jgi:hypothetical protein
VWDAVGPVPDAEHLEAREAVEDVAVPRARAAEHHGGDRGEAAVGVGVQGHVVGAGDDIGGIEGGQAARVAPRLWPTMHGDVRLLVFVFVHQPPHLCQHRLAKYRIIREMRPDAATDVTYNAKISDKI